MSRLVNREEFDLVCQVLWEELEYQNDLPRKTSNEAKDVPGFATLARRYLRNLEDDWADNAAILGTDGITVSAQVPEALHSLRKLAAIFVRAMVYCGSIRRAVEQEKSDG